MFKILDFIKQIFRGRSIYRILFNWQVREHCGNLSGSVLDLAGGSNPSYYAYLPQDLNIIKTDYKKQEGVDKIIDINKPLPFNDGLVEYVFLFNAFYIVKDCEMFLGELRRIIKKGGQIFIATPFIANEMPEPDDFRRLSKEGLGQEFRRAGFTDFTIVRFGERFSAAAYLLHPFFIFNIVRLLAYSLCLCLDKMIPKKIKKIHPTPLGYFCVIKL